MKATIRTRVAATVGRQVAVFLLAYGIGVVVASVISPFLTPFLGFLAIPIFGGITLLFVVINGLVTFPIAAYLFQHYNAEPDL